MAWKIDGITPIEKTDREYLILLADELEKAVSNDNGQEGFIRISNELALILSKRMRDNRMKYIRLQQCGVILKIGQIVKRKHGAQNLGWKNLMLIRGR